jgi:hypothetical protein
MEPFTVVLGLLIRVALPLALLMAASAKLQAWDGRRIA